MAAFARVQAHPEYGKERIVLAYGIGQAAVRGGPDEPWLPLSHLLPAMLRATEVRLRYAGLRERENGEPRPVRWERRVRLAGLKAAARWCTNGLTDDDPEAGRR